MKNSIGNDSQKLSREARKLRRAALAASADMRGSVSHALAGPANDLLLHAPYDAPHIQHHEPADAAADTDGQRPVALPAFLIERQKDSTLQRR